MSRGLLGRHGRDHRPGGSDPIPGLPTLTHFSAFADTTMTADICSNNYIALLKSAYSPTVQANSGEYTLETDGGVTIQTPGLYAYHLQIIFTGSTWQTVNFYCGIQYVLASQTLGGICGSQDFTGTTLEHQVSDDGTNRTNATDIRKPELASIGIRWFPDLGEPLRLLPSLYSHTASQSVDVDVNFRLLGV